MRNRYDPYSAVAWRCDGTYYHASSCVGKDAFTAPHIGSDSDCMDRGRGMRVVYFSSVPPAIIIPLARLNLYAMYHHVRS